MDSRDIKERKINELFSESIEKRNRTDTLGIISLILGTFGLLFSFCCTFMAILPGVTAVLCGAIAYNQGQRYAPSGIILGILTILAGIALTFIGMR